ncbi:unnamed protein product, partial [Onchocerca flexuosa]|uniref:Triacylglycerol lipase n=1 Tax=Onchocerca flexuosa TaxID=387005 RepID=A0A183I8M3_9BILA
SLTNSIDTFIGIAGPNHGVNLKIGQADFPACMFSLLPICNQRTGLFSGLCPQESAFLTVTARIRGQHGEKVYNEKNHEQTFRDSLPVQLQMILNHIVI